MVFCSLPVCQSLAVASRKGTRTGQDLPLKPDGSHCAEVTSLRRAVVIRCLRHSQELGRVCHPARVSGWAPAASTAPCHGHSARPSRQTPARANLVILTCRKFREQGIKCHCPQDPFRDTPKVVLPVSVVPVLSSRQGVKRDQGKLSCVSSPPVTLYG